MVAEVRIKGETAMWRMFGGTVVVVLIAVLAIEVYYGYRFYENQAEDRSSQEENKLTEMTFSSEELSKAPEVDDPNVDTTASEAAAGGLGATIIFVHRTTPENIVTNSTYLDNSMTNGEPDAVLLATQNWNTGMGSGVYNDHPIGVWYDPNARRWAIFNQDREEMPEGAAFNVLISRKP